MNSCSYCVSASKRVGPYTECTHVFLHPWDVQQCWSSEFNETSWENNTWFDCWLYRLSCMFELHMRPTCANVQTNLAVKFIYLYGCLSKALKDPSGQIHSVDTQSPVASQALRCAPVEKGYIYFEVAVPITLVSRIIRRHWHVCTSSTTEQAGQPYLLLVDVCSLICLINSPVSLQEALAFTLDNLFPYFWYLHLCLPWPEPVTCQQHTFTSWCLSLRSA